jgi:glycosyltransferase involved in cell wall biosynthesis
VVVVMPAYNAASTLQRTHREVMEQECVDEIVLVDDASTDTTAAIARALPHTSVHVHDKNRGYGGNQKTCYRRALESGAGIVVMVHPDYQYTPRLIPAMVALIGNGLYDCVLGSRILGGQAMRSGMPWWRYVSNRFLTAVANLGLGAKLSEYHTGYRAFSRRLLESLPLDANSDDFVFDSQVLAEAVWHGCTIAEISCPTRYAADASSINFLRSVRYGFGCLWTTLEFVLARAGVRSRRFPREQRGRFGPHEAPADAGG